MNINSQNSPILLVPYMWIGDFVRCHSVVKLLQQRWPQRPIDYLTSSNNAPLLDYMTGVRAGIVWDLPRGRLPLGQYLGLAKRLRSEHYGSALIMLRTWKAALAPYLAGIPERVGFVGEGRFVLLNDLRWGERKLERMIDRCAALALPKDAALPTDWPLPELAVPPAELAEWRSRQELTDQGLTDKVRPVVALAPGAIGQGKRWDTAHYAALARLLTAQNIDVWVVGGPNESPLAKTIADAGGFRVRDLTGADLRNAILALAAADAAVTNDSGLMHVSAALGTPTVALFGPTSPRLWAPLNPLAAALEPAGGGPLTSRSIDEIPPAQVFEAVQQALVARA